MLSGTELKIIKLFDSDDVIDNEEANKSNTMSLMIAHPNHLKIIEIDFLVFSKAAFVVTPTAASVIQK
uniref:Uncharacterized protein n=1 Tax=Romanomermis culicivorax TaxID=13658 RepID=A0A915KBM7_ROMCU